MNYSKPTHSSAKSAAVLARLCQLWLLAISSLFFLPASAWAEIAANVSFVSGTVTAQTSGASERELAKDHDIFSGDTINTAENGRIQMRFTDGGLVSLMPQTLFSVDEYLHEGQATDDGSLVFGMLRGGMRTITGSIGRVKHENYELKTPVATLGIRGTEYVAVIGPPDTLRVHVGAGKVVITNDHGTLEVDAGKNAVVVLGSAPELTEQGPLYIASAPGGDGSVIDGLVDQDPLWRDVVFHVLDGPTPTPPSGIPPNGPGYLMAGYNPGASSNGLYTTIGPASFDATFDQTTGALLDVTNDSNTNINGMLTDYPGYLAGNISWGALVSNGSGMLGGGLVSSYGQYLPYVVGSVAQTVPSGLLTYNLAGATPVFESGVAVGTLDSFSLNINLGLPSSYSFGGQLTIPSTVYALSNSGSMLTGTKDGFSLSGTAISSTCPSGCVFNVEGFLAGPNAEQAGISYILSDNTENYTGTAGLTRP